LTLAVVTRQVPCAVSFLSYVESGHRALQPWLAEALDRIYQKQMAHGYALAGSQDESRRALDAAMTWLAQPVREDDAFLGQLIAINDDLFAVYQGEACAGLRHCWPAC
jgi:hypothetical protein